MTYYRIRESRFANDPKTPIQFKFLRWLFLYGSFAFISSLVLSLIFATRSVKKEALQILQTRISNAYEHSKISNNALTTLKTAASAIGIQRARALSLILQSDPTIVVEGNSERTTRNLGKVGRLLNVDLIDISDEEGVVCATWPTGAAELGFYLGDGEYSKQFLTLLDNPKNEVSQEIRPREAKDDRALYQFSGVAQKSALGIVEIGFRAQSIEKALSLTNVSNSVGSLATEGGFLWIYKRNSRASKKITNEANLAANVPSPPDRPLGSFSTTVRESEPEGQISGPQFKEQSVDKLLTAPTDVVSTCLLDDGFSKDKSAYLILAQDLKVGNDPVPYRFVGGILKREVYKTRRLLVFLLVLANTIVFFTVFTLISKLVKNLIVDGVYSINRSLEKITRGDLNERVLANSSSEFVDLSNGINSTVDSLKREVSEVKKRVDRELSLAKQIQEASLPNLEQLYSNRKDYDVFAKNKPMRSVGGDMFDFFPLDNENILFYIADVSGHGIPGALVMMKTMALVKNLALSGYDLEKVISITNKNLSENNDSSFVTGFFCVVNLPTGVMTYVNAGHNSPFIRKGSGKFCEFQPEINLIMGILPEAEYVSHKIKLNPNDAFVLFTDGVTEATTPFMNECFEVHRALAVLNNTPNGSKSRVYVEALFNAVERFTKGQDPSDDITVLFFQYKHN